MNMSKFCDAADWFDPAVEEIIRSELREPARFHRKQWEFAMIFLALRRLGMVGPDKVGLSLGGGTERLLYTLATHVQQMIVTDLYDTSTSWDCARTDDPDKFVKSHKPFEVDDTKYRAIRMDMRSLDFPDRSFDFCYSSCAVEHIGGDDDFLRHFSEAARVLKDGGVYVFTTEVSYLDETIRDPHNYVFSLEHLGSLIGRSELQPMFAFDASIAHHRANSPFPSNLVQIATDDPRSLAWRSIENLPHITLLRGRHPHTSGLFVLQKRRSSNNGRPLKILSLDSSRLFIERGLEEYLSALATSRAIHNPFSMLAQQQSRFYLDHQEYFTKVAVQGLDRETVFHSDYIWFGEGKRTFEVELSKAGEYSRDDCIIDLRVHRFRTLDSQHVDCIEQRTIVTDGAQTISERVPVLCEADSCYAILGKRASGSCLFDSIKVSSYPESMATPGAAERRAADVEEGGGSS